VRCTTTGGRCMECNKTFKKKTKREATSSATDGSFGARSRVRPTYTKRGRFTSALTFTGRNSPSAALPSLAPCY